MSFNVGAKVRLKSGGPCMTVVEPVLSDSVVCSWFDQSRTLQQATFPFEALKPCKSGDDAADSYQKLLDIKNS